MPSARHPRHYLTENDGIYWVHSSRLHYYFRSFRVDYLHHLSRHWTMLHGSLSTLSYHRHPRWTSFLRRRRVRVRLCANVESGVGVGQAGDDCYWRCHANGMNYDERRPVSCVCHLSGIPFTYRWAIVSSCLDEHRILISNPEMSSRNWSTRSPNRNSPRSNWSMFSCLPRKQQQQRWCDKDPLWSDEPYLSNVFEQFN